jgi:predicted RNase H-like HicB family nuclease
MEWLLERERLMQREFNVVIERDAEGFYVASIPTLRGCHTQSRSLDELVDRVREAAELYLTVQDSDGELLVFIGLQRIAVAM